MCAVDVLAVGFVTPSADSMAGSGLRGLVAGVVASLSSQLGVALVVSAMPPRGPRANCPVLGGPEVVNGEPAEG